MRLIYPMFALIARLALIAAAAVPAAAAADLERGRMLHENHCRMCHDSIAYKRGDRIAGTYAQIKAQVTRWQTNTGLRWSEADIDSVTAFVAKTYYKLPVPTQQ
jgi:mono/diheme cytochrome c family protein